MNSINVAAYRDNNSHYDPAKPSVSYRPQQAPARKSSSHRKSTSRTEVIIEMEIQEKTKRIVQIKNEASSRIKKERITRSASKAKIPEVLKLPMTIIPRESIARSEGSIYEVDVEEDFECSVCHTVFDGDESLRSHKRKGCDSKPKTRGYMLRSCKKTGRGDKQASPSSQRSKSLDNSLGNASSKSLDKNSKSSPNCSSVNVINKSAKSSPPDIIVLPSPKPIRSKSPDIVILPTSRPVRRAISDVIIMPAGQSTKTSDPEVIILPDDKSTKGPELDVIVMPTEKSVKAPEPDSSTVANDKSSKTCKGEPSVKSNVKSSKTPQVNVSGKSSAKTVNEPQPRPNVSSKEKAVFGTQRLLRKTNTEPGVSGNRLLKCTQCLASFTDKALFQRHLSQPCKDTKPNFRCPYCDYRSGLKQTIQEHQMKMHPRKSVQIVTIKYPLSSTKTETRLDRNKSNTMAFERHRCGFCPSEFKMKHNYIRHRKYECRTLKYQCQYCDYRSRWTSNIYVHIRKSHPSKALQFKLLKMK